MQEEKEAVISVEDVGMQFRIPLESQESLKDYLIGFLKGKQKFRVLKALDHISFQVRKER